MERAVKPAVLVGDDDPRRRYGRDYRIVPEYTGRSALDTLSKLEKAPVAFCPG